MSRFTIKLLILTASCFHCIRIFKTENVITLSTMHTSSYHPSYQRYDDNLHYDQRYDQRYDYVLKPCREAEHERVTSLKA